MTSAPLRFGLVGTGYRARIAHAPALASTEGIELAAVWGRDPRAAAGLAADFRAPAHEDLDAFLAAVDGVAFAVPPCVQAPIAAAAARAGKHLPLEKPIAISEAEADDLVEAVAAGQVASVVFFTSGSGRRCGPGWPTSRHAVAGWGAWPRGSGRPCSSPARSTPRGGARRARCGMSPRT